jgi:sulfide:quinone oxidoreductase
VAREDRTEPEHATGSRSIPVLVAACVASAGANPFTGTVASMTVFPIVPDYERYPAYGRDIKRRLGAPTSSTNYATTH